jgi:hypothetical protein
MQIELSVLNILGFDKGGEMPGKDFRRFLAIPARRPGELSLSDTQFQPWRLILSNGRGCRIGCHGFIGTEMGQAGNDCRQRWL